MTTSDQIVRSVVDILDVDRELDALLASVESEIVEAGEACTENYQTLVDWTVIDTHLGNVKRLIREAWGKRA